MFYLAILSLKGCRSLHKLTGAGSMADSLFRALESFDQIHTYFIFEHPSIAKQQQHIVWSKYTNIEYNQKGNKHTPFPNQNTVC